MKRVYFIYTIPAFYTALYQPVMSRYFAAHPELEVRFMMDSSLLLDTLANDAQPTPAVERRLLHCAEFCQQAGADVIVVGCTAVNTASKKIAPMLDIPLISVDEPMIQKVLADGKKKIAVLSHTPINAMTIQRRLLAEDSSLEVALFSVAGAADAFNAEDISTYHSLMKAAAEGISKDFDAIVLGHISAEDVDFSQVSLPVYKTGANCIAAMEAVLADK